MADRAAIGGPWAPSLGAGLRNAAGTRGRSPGGRLYGGDPAFQPPMHAEAVQESRAGGSRPTGCRAARPVTNTCTTIGIRGWGDCRVVGRPLDYALGSADMGGPSALPPNPLHRATSPAAPTRGRWSRIFAPPRQFLGKVVDRLLSASHFAWREVPKLAAPPHRLTQWRARPSWSRNSFCSVKPQRGRRARLISEGYARNKIRASGGDCRGANENAPVVCRGES